MAVPVGHTGAQAGSVTADPPAVPAGAARGREEGPAHWAMAGTVMGTWLQPISRGQRKPLQRLWAAAALPHAWPLGHPPENKWDHTGLSKG